MKNESLQPITSLKTREVITNSSPHCNVGLILDTGIDEERIDEEIKNLIAPHTDDLCELAKFSHRLFLLTSIGTKTVAFASGQAIPVAPGLWLSLNHVANCEGVQFRTIRNANDASYAYSM